MKKLTLKSISAVFVGLIATTIFSILADIVFEKSGVMKTNPFHENPVWVILVIILYRTIFSIVGAFLAARLAPHKPLKHAIALGIVGIILSVMGLIIMWDVPPRWYPISLIVLTMPSVWIGGKLAMKSKR